MKDLKQVAKITAFAALVLFFSSCSKESDDIPEPQEQVTEQNDDGDNANTNNDNGSTDVVPGDIDNDSDNSIVGGWTISSILYNTVDEDGNVTGSGNGIADGNIVFNADGTGTRNYTYVSSVLDEGNYYFIADDFTWAYDENPDTDKILVTNADGNTVTWTRESDTAGKQTFTWRLNIQDVIHEYSVELTSGATPNHFVGAWNINAMQYEVLSSGETGNAFGEGTVTFNEDGSGTRSTSFQSSILDSEGDNKVHGSNSDFTWYLVGMNRIKLDVVFETTDANGNPTTVEWTETWTRTMNDNNKQKVSYSLNLGNPSVGHRFNVTFTK